MWTWQWMPRLRVVQTLPASRHPCEVDCCRMLVLTGLPDCRCHGQDGPDYYDQNTWIGPLRPDFLPREQESFRSEDDEWAGHKVRSKDEGRWGSQLHFLDDDRYSEEAYVKVGHWTFVKVRACICAFAPN